MNKQEENALIPEAAAPKGVIQSAKDFVNGVLSPLKGKDVGQMVEDFTSEMTMVAEGLSEDQEKLARETDRLSAQQTELEQKMLDGFHDQDVTADEMRREIDTLKSRLDKAEKLLREKKEKKSEGLAGILRQATYLVAIGAGAWVIVTLINALT